MKKLLALIALAAFAGCATVDTIAIGSDFRVEDGSEAIETVEISNTTWLFLSCLPIAGGDVDSPNHNSCSWFSRTTSMENQMKMLQAEAERVGARKAVNVTTFTTDEDALLFLFLREKYHTSAVLVK